MKKMKLTLILGLMLVVLVGCNAKEEDKAGETVPEVPVTEGENEAEGEAITQSCVEVLNGIWADYSLEKFSVGGGDEDHMTMDAAGEYSPTKTEALQSMYCVDPQTAGIIKSMATLQHMLNANVFTGMVIETEDVDALAATMETNIKNNHWMCGSPNVYSIVQLDATHVLVMYGDVAIVNEFEKIAGEQYDTTVIKSGTV